MKEGIWITVESYPNSREITWIELLIDTYLKPLFWVSEVISLSSMQTQYLMPF